MLELRAEYKRLMCEATDPDEKLGYDMMQTAMKVLVNRTLRYDWDESPKVCGLTTT